MNISIKTIKIASFAFMLSLSLTACNESDESDAVETEMAAEQKVIEQIKIPVSQKLADITVKQSAMALSVFMVTLDFTDEQKACINNIKISDAVVPVKVAFEEQFTDEELQKILDMYNHPDIKAMTDYGLQVAKQMVGMKIAKPLPEPASAKVGTKLLTEFAATEIGQRLAKFTEANTLVKAEMGEKITTCDITTSIDELIK